MNVQQFTCVNQHIFFLPLDFPIALNDFLTQMNQVTCPICECSNDQIRMDARRMKVRVRE